MITLIIMALGLGGASLAAYLASDAAKPNLGAIKTKMFPPKSRVAQIEGKKITFGTDTSADIYKEYMELPIDKRPGVDLVGQLRALEVKYTSDAVNNHFNYRTTTDRYGYTNRKTSRHMNASYCNEKRCHEFPEFAELFTLIRGIKEQMKIAERDAELAAVKGTLDDYKNTKQAFEDEIRLAKETNEYMRSF